MFLSENAQVMRNKYNSTTRDEMRKLMVGEADFPAVFFNFYHGAKSAETGKGIARSTRWEGASSRER